MELRPKYEAPPWAPTNKGQRNYVLTMRHHHATIVELRPNQMRHHHEISPRECKTREINLIN